MYYKVLKDFNASCCKHVFAAGDILKFAYRDSSNYFIFIDCNSIGHKLSANQCNIYLETTDE